MFCKEIRRTSTTNPLALEKGKKKGVMTTENEHKIHLKKTHTLHDCTTPY